jgi:hypothetical protein
MHACVFKFCLGKIYLFSAFIFGVIWNGQGPHRTPYQVFGRPKLQNQAELLDTAFIKIVEDKNLLRLSGSLRLNGLIVVRCEIVCDLCCNPKTRATASALALALTIVFVYTSFYFISYFISKNFRISFLFPSYSYSIIYLNIVN